MAEQAFKQYDRVAHVPSLETGADMDDLGTVIEVHPVHQRLRGGGRGGKVLRYLYTVRWDTGAAPYNTDTYTERQLSKVADAPPMSSAADFITEANVNPAFFCGIYA